MFTQEEITIIKSLIEDKKREIELQQINVRNNNISIELAKIAGKYEKKLEKAAQDGDIIKRKQLIEELTVEANAKEAEMLN